MFNREQRRKMQSLGRQRVRNKSWRTAHPSQKKQLKNKSELSKEIGIIKTMSNKMKLGILASNPNNGKGLGLLRKFLSR